MAAGCRGRCACARIELWGRKMHLTAELQPGAPSAAYGSSGWHTYCWQAHVVKYDGINGNLVLTRKILLHPCSQAGTQPDVQEVSEANRSEFQELQVDQRRITLVDGG